MEARHSRTIQHGSSLYLDLWRRGLTALAQCDAIVTEIESDIGLDLLPPDAELRHQYMEVLEGRAQLLARQHTLSTFEQLNRWHAQARTLVGSCTFIQRELDELSGRSGPVGSRGRPRTKNRLPAVGTVDAPLPPALQAAMKRAASVQATPPPAPRTQPTATRSSSASSGTVGCLFMIMLALAGGGWLWHTIGNALEPPHPPPTQAVFSRSGEGNRTTRNFYTHRLWEVDYSYDCSADNGGEFSLTVDSSNGDIGGDFPDVDRTDLTGTGKVEETNGGQYYLDIETNCAWTVNVRQ